MPEIVNEQGKKADELHRQLYPDNYPPADPTEVVVSPPATPAEPKPAAPATPPAADPQKPEDDYKHKYEVLQGKYDAEIKKLLEENATIKGYLASLPNPQQPPAQPQPATPPSQPAPAPAPAAAESESVKELKEVYPLIYDGVKQMLDSYMNVFITRFSQEFEQKLAPRIAKVEEFQVKRSVQDLYRYLDQNCPDWKKIDHDPRFTEWLQKKAPYSNKTKFQLLREAYQALDQDSVLDFFKDFQKESGATYQAPPATPVVPPVDPASVSTPPSGGGTPPPPTSQEEPIKRSDLRQFYQDVANGKYRGRDAEKNAAEALIMKAMREGRVVEG